MGAEMEGRKDCTHSLFDFVNDVANHISCNRSILTCYTTSPPTPPLLPSLPPLKKPRPGGQQSVERDQGPRGRSLGGRSGDRRTPSGECK